MDIEKIITLLFVSAVPITKSKLSTLLGVEQQELEHFLPVVEKALSQVGLALLITEKDVVIATKKEHTSLVELFKKDELQGDLTPATLQVLTLVAYLGTPTREQISYIRGVQSSQSLRTLTVRGLIARQGETCFLTTEALQLLGITKKEELPDYENISSSFYKKMNEHNEV